MDKETKNYAKIILFEAFHEIAAYHGTSADFDKFDSYGHAGEGAGSQSFGFGTYVTNDRVIGKSYADSSKRNVLDISRPKDILNYMSPSVNILGIDDKSLYDTFRYLNMHNFDVDVTIEELSTAMKILKEKMEAEPYYAEQYRERMHNYYVAFNILSSIDKRFTNKNAIVYHVEVPDDNGLNYLSWYDIVPPDQMRRIYLGLYKLGDEKLKQIGRSDYGFKSTLEGYLTDEENVLKIIDILCNEKNHQTFLSNYTEPTGSGSQIYRRLQSWFGSDREASKFLSNCGFTGIKYPTGTIWKKPEGSNESGENYVIFNDNDIEIKEKENV